MVGGKFRLGTASIYIAEYGHIRPQHTSFKFYIAWLRSRLTYGSFSSSFNRLIVEGRKKLSLKLRRRSESALKPEGMDAPVQLVLNPTKHRPASASVAQENRVDVARFERRGQDGLARAQKQNEPKSSFGTIRMQYRERSQRHQSDRIAVSS